MQQIKGFLAILGKAIFMVLKGAIATVSAVGGFVIDRIYGRAVIVPAKSNVVPTKAKADPGSPVAKVTAKTAVDPSVVQPPKIDAAAQGNHAEASRAQPPQTQGEQSAAPLIAQRVWTAELFGKGGLKLGVLWVYTYPDKGMARRVFKVTNRALASALKRERWYMDDVTFDPLIGVRPILDQMGRDCAKLMNQPGQTPVREKTAAKSKPMGTRPVAAAAPTTKAPAAQAAKATEVAETISPTIVTPNHSRAVKGQIYAGRVTTAGMTNRGGYGGKAPYQTFCLTIHDGKVETPLFGAELQRQASDMQIQPGDQVRVVYMGQEALPNGNTRNLYQVTKS